MNRQFGIAVVVFAAGLLSFSSCAGAATKAKAQGPEVESTEVQLEKAKTKADTLEAQLKAAEDGRAKAEKAAIAEKSRADSLESKLGVAEAKVKAADAACREAVERVVVEADTKLKEAQQVAREAARKADEFSKENATLKDKIKDWLRGKPELAVTADALIKKDAEIAALQAQLDDQIRLAKQAVEQARSGQAGKVQVEAALAEVEKARDAAAKELEEKKKADQKTSKYDWLW